MRESERVIRPEQELVRRQLDKIVASGGFNKADRLCRFLRFTVEASLNGESTQIKEYSLGREVFDRKEDYDPRLDSIVRVEARRLRTRLHEYYSGAGQSDPVRIEYPKGSYIPVIRAAVQSDRRLASRGRHATRVAIALVVLGAAILGAFRLLQPHVHELLLVVPARWVQPDSAGLNRLDESLAEAVTGELANRGAARVIGWPLVTPYRTQGKQVLQVAAELAAAKVLLVMVRDAGGKDAGARVNLFLLDGVTGQKEWYAEYRPQDAALPGTQHQLAQQIAEDFGVAQKQKTRR